MIADLKPYDEYKDSGLPWLGQVPSHWETKRAKSVLFAIDKRSETGQEELLTVSSAHGVIPRRGATVTMFKAKTYKGYKLCWPDDLVINSLWAWGGGLGVARHHGIISTAYGVYRIRHTAEYHPGYLHALVRSRPFNWELVMRSKGIWISRLQLTDDSFLNAPIPIFPPDEQELIVRFLDWASVRLEKAIRAKRRVIALLEEQKQAIIHRAVTRGLDDTVPLKPSGLDWLGDIPEGWDVKRAGALFAERKENGIKGLPLLVVSLNTGVTVGKALDHRGREKRLIADVEKYSLTRKGDIAYNMMRMWQGAVGVVLTDGMVSPAYVVARPRTSATNTTYYELFFRTDACKGEVNRQSTGIVSDRNRLYWDSFKQLKLPVRNDKTKQKNSQAE